MTISFSLVPPGSGDAVFAGAGARASIQRLIRQAGKRKIARLALSEAEVEMTVDVLRATDDLDVILRHEIQGGSPCGFAAYVAALNELLDGRLSLKVTPGSVAALASDTDGIAASWHRMDEYLTLLKRLWCNDAPFDHEGAFYSINRGLLEHRGRLPVDPEIRMDGCSALALQVAGRHADVFELPVGTFDETRVMIERVVNAATPFGRARKVRFALPMPAIDGAGATVAQRLAGLEALGVTEIMLPEAGYALSAASPSADVSFAPAFWLHGAEGRFPLYR